MRCKELHGRALTILVNLSKQVGLRTNTTKTKCVTFLPGRIKVRQSNRVYAQRQEGLISAEQWHAHVVRCGVCGEVLQARNLYQHLEDQHEVYRSRIIDRDLLIN